MREVTLAVLQAGLGARVPTYVYDLEKLNSRCEQIKKLPMAHKKVFFATMANDHPVILSFIRDSGLGVFVNSLAHLKLVLELGFKPEKIVFAASNMLAEEMKFCVEERVNLVLDSLGQIEALGRVANRPVEIGVRLNVGSALDGKSIRPDPIYRFGLLVDELPQALSIARQRQIKIIGAHSYFGTGVMKPEILLEGLECLGAAACNLPDLSYLDVGGGFGVPDGLDDAEFSIEDYGQRAEAIMKRHESRLGRSLALYVEPGRYLAADSGYFFVRVVDCKIREDRVFVGTNGSVANFPRPLIYPDRAHHPCEIVGERGKGPLHPTPMYVCGNSTYSQDFLARGINLPLPEPGDTLIFHHAGAYGRSMITNFLGKDRPEEIIIDRVKAANLT